MMAEGNVAALIHQYSSNLRGMSERPAAIEEINSSSSRQPQEDLTTEKVQKPTTFFPTNGTQFSVQADTQSSSHRENAMLTRRHSEFIQDLLENLLTCVTCRDSSQRERSQRQLQDMPNIKSSDVPVKDSDVSGGNNKDATARDCGANSTPEAESSDTGSEDDIALPTTPIPEVHLEPDNVPLSKNEQDANKLHIPRPEFVITKEHTLVQVGTISAVLENAVIVTTFNLTERPPQLSDADLRNATALDSGSLLCFADRTVLGAVFETFGPVSSPLYVVRFNSKDEIPIAAGVRAPVLYVEQEMSLVRGQDVRGKGYDASGKDDEEADCQEFSDDELERRAKKMKRSCGSEQKPGPFKRARNREERTMNGQKGRKSGRRDDCIRLQERSSHSDVGNSAPVAREGRYQNARRYDPSARSRYHPSALAPRDVSFAPPQHGGPLRGYPPSLFDPSTSWKSTIHEPNTAFNAPSFNHTRPEFVPAPSGVPPPRPYAYDVPPPSFPAQTFPYAIPSAASQGPQFAHVGHFWPQQMPLQAGHGYPPLVNQQQSLNPSGAPPEPERAFAPFQAPSYLHQEAGINRSTQIAHVGARAWGPNHVQYNTFLGDNSRGWQDTTDERYHNG